MNWSNQELDFVRRNIGRMTIEEMAEHLTRSPRALQMLIHRKRMSPPTPKVKFNRLKMLLALRFKHLEDFTPSRAFFRECHISQKRYWSLFYGRDGIKQEEYRAIRDYLMITPSEAAESRQLYLFEE